MSFFAEPDLTINDDAPAGYHRHGVLANPKRVSPVKGLYSWFQKKLPTAGAQNFAFESLGLVEFAVIGRATAQREFLKVFQAPQLYVRQGVPTTGIGGLQAGQMALQPLYDPNTNTYGGA